MQLPVLFVALYPPEHDAGMNLVALGGGDDRWQGGRGDPESAGEEPRGGLVVGGDLVRVALGFHEIIVDDGGSFR